MASTDRKGYDEFIKKQKAEFDEDKKKKQAEKDK